MPGEMKKLEDEVSRLRSHLDSIKQNDRKACAEEFRKFVAESREPFHENHDEINTWNEEKGKPCGCTIC